MPLFHMALRVCVLAAICCALSLAAALSFVHRLPLPELEMNLSLCRVPCWGGLEPGYTPMEDVPEILRTSMRRSAVNIQPYERYTGYVVEVPSHGIVGAISARAGLVSMIRLDVGQPLWPLLVLLHAPRCIEPVETEVGYRTFNIYWEVDGVYVMANAIRSAAYGEIMTSSLNLWIPAATAPCEKYGQVLPWPGYAVFSARS